MYVQPMYEQNESIGPKPTRDPWLIAYRDAEVGEGVNRPEIEGWSGGRQRQGGSEEVKSLHFDVSRKRIGSLTVVKCSIRIT
jgi:hypothetical protein